MSKNISKFDFNSFIKKYSNNEIKLIGCYGIIKTSILKKLESSKLNSFGPYSDICTILIAYEGEILWQNNKLVFLRTHENSISVKSIDLNAYTSAEKVFK